MTAEEVVLLIKEKSTPAYLAGVAHFGIDSSKALGTSLPELRKIAKSIKKDGQKK